MRSKLLALVLALSLAGPAFANPDKPDLASLARQAVSEDASESTHAIEALRAAGPAGFEAFLSAHHEAIEARCKEVASDHPPAASMAWQRTSRALDAIAGQKDSFASRLFWYTDFEQAVAAARLA